MMDTARHCQLHCSTSYSHILKPALKLGSQLRFGQFTGWNTHKGWQAPKVATNSQSRRFRNDFNPSDTGLPPAVPFVTPLDISQIEELPGGPPAHHWARDPPGAFRALNPHAPLTRLAPAGVPNSPTGEEFYYVEMQRNHVKELPGIQWSPEGKPELKLGFLQPFFSPLLPGYFHAIGIEKFQYSLLDRAVHALVALGAAAAGVVAFNMVWEQNYNLAAVLVVNWARSKLSLGRVALVLSLAWIGKLWIYWVFFLGGLIDQLLMRIAPPIRRFAWTMFVLWIIYLALSPLHFYPLPFGGLGPFNNPMEAIGPSAIQPLR